MRVRALALPFLATAALAACSSHPSPSSSSGAPDAAHFAGVMADAFCGALQACCSARSIIEERAVPETCAGMRGGTLAGHFADGQCAHNRASISGAASD